MVVLITVLLVSISNYSSTKAELKSLKIIVCRNNVTHTPNTSHSNTSSSNGK